MLLVIIFVTVFTLSFLTGTMGMDNPNRRPMK